MKRNQLEHTLVTDNCIMFNTSCACADTDHTLTISVSKEEHDKCVSLELEMYFKVRLTDFHSWEHACCYADDNLYSKLIAFCKERLSIFGKLWNRVKIATQMLLFGHIELHDAFTFRSGTQAKAVYDALGEAAKHFISEEEKLKNSEKQYCSYLGG